MVRYRDGMTDAEMQKLLLSVKELDEAYARAADEISLAAEGDESGAQEAEYYDQLRKEFGR
jgi:hypothetical protein